MSEVSSEAKNYLNRELGNQQRFLYEYGYSQIVDILEQGGFLRMPDPAALPIKDLDEARKLKPSVEKALRTRESDAK